MNREPTAAGIDTSAHPGPAELIDFSLGRLDEYQSALIERHIESCEVCSQQMALAAAQEDTLVACIREAPFGGSDNVRESLRLHAGYELREIIGQGGMAVVWRAYHRTLGRSVALKQIRSGTAAGADEVVRFHREVTAAAQLSHPGIVQVFDSGEQDGQPYLAMELLEGGTLAERLQMTPLDSREAARLLVRLSDAVQYAHTRGIVHRDLKPANVLFTSRPLSGGPLSIVECEPKLADFGLARRDHDPAYTLSGIAVGTPGYMAPEQTGDGRIAGKSADIYGLGAILYQCLTGRPPFGAPDVLETLRQVREDTPVAPVRLQPKCDRDVETICLKCLNKEPAARYSAAADLRDDLQRFLDGHSISARRTSVRERLWKWCRRRPAQAALIAVSAILLIGLSAAGWVVSGILEKSLAERTKAQQEAETRLQQIRDTWNVNLWNVAEEALLNVPESLGIRRRLLELAVRQYEDLYRGQDAADAETQHALTILLISLADVMSAQEAKTEGDLVYTKSIRLNDELLRNYPEDNDIRQQAGVGRTHYGLHLIRTGRGSDAVRVLAIAQDILESLVQRDVSRTEWRGALAQNSDAAASASSAAGLPDHAVAFHRRAVELARELDSTQNPDVVIKRMLTSIFHNAGLFEADPAEKISLLRKSMSLAEQIVAEHPESWQGRDMLANILVSLGSSLNQTSPEEATSQIDRARALYEVLAIQFPRIRSHRSNVARCDYMFAVMCLNTSRDDLVLERVQRSARAYRQLLDEIPSDAAMAVLFTDAQNLLGLKLSSQSDHEGAETCYKQNIEILEAILRENETDLACQRSLAASCQNYSELLRLSGRTEQALNFANRAVELGESVTQATGGRESPFSHLIPAHGSRALILQQLNRHGEAVISWDRILQVSGNSAVASWRMSLLFCLAGADDYQRAAKEAAALTQRTDISADDRYNLACILSLAADHLRKSQGASEPVPSRQDSVEIELAIQQLQQLHREGYFENPARNAHARTDKDLEPLRGDSRFRQIFPDDDPPRL